MGKECTELRLSYGEQTALRNMAFSNRASLETSGINTPYTLGSVNSISVGFADLVVVNAQRAEAFIGEASGPNKRAHVEEEPPREYSQPSRNVLTQQPAFNSGIPQTPFIFRAPAPERPKKRGQKRAGKQVVMNPLVGMINDRTGFIDQQTLIRQLLKSHKVDLSWMDLCALSPTVCQEMKRLLTRMSKKREKTKTRPQAQNLGQMIPTMPF